ncbi:MAG: acyl-ACP desaturase [Actinobacteria bacterium]|nr:acyl-ACP desaturase [Actinomycetota bacterium]MCB9390618.1 acyl-ACP desaturase [Acidimicrobiia bacterium]
MSVQDVLNSLEPTVEQLMDRHMRTTKEWFPHETSPWALGIELDFTEDWVAELSPFNRAARSSLYVNLLTEDNLPYYFRDIDDMFGPDGAWGAWSRRWTAEEGRHSIAMRDYMILTKAVDPVELERARMNQVGKGEVPAPDNALEALAYVAIQELATRIAHFNTGKHLDDPVGYEMLKRVSTDENFHHLFYRDLVSTTLEIDPGAMVQAIAAQVEGFAMPGTGIPGFDRHAQIIARAGIYDLTVHVDQILKPLIYRQWKLDTLTGLTPEADQARTNMFAFIDALDELAIAQREKSAERAAARV